MQLARTLGWAALVVGALTAGAATASAETVEGTLVDAKCYLMDNGLTTNDHGDMKECGTMCLKMGQPAAVVTGDKAFHPIVASSIALAAHVGETVRVTGALHNGAILAEKVEVNTNGRWTEVKLGSMM